MGNDAMTFVEDKIARYIWLILPPIIIIFGTVGNVLSFVVVNQHRRNRTSTTTYLSVLAICDLLVIYIGLLRLWVSETFGFDIRNVNDTACKIHFYLINFTLQFSSWILVAVTVERVISVWKPHVAKVECTKGVASCTLAIISMVLMVLNGHILFGVKIRIVSFYQNGSISDDTGNDSIRSCEPDVADENYSQFMYYIWTLVDFCVVFFVPFLLLMVGNIIIIINVKRSKQFRRTVTKDRLLSKRPQISFTAMLLSLNYVFFVCLSPVNVYIIGQFHWWPYNAIGHTQAIQNLLWAIVNILMYTNNAINFVLYILCGSEFRVEVKLLLRKVFSVICPPDLFQIRSPKARRTLLPNTSIELTSM